VTARAPDPYTAAAQALTAIGSTPTGSSAWGRFDSAFRNDNSGWTVSTGGSTARGGNRSEVSSPTPSGAADQALASYGAGPMFGGSNVLPYVFALAALIALSRMTKG
jgi:hypothetical protein